MKSSTLLVKLRHVIKIQYQKYWTIHFWKIWWLEVHNFWSKSNSGMRSHFAKIKWINKPDRVLQICYARKEQVKFLTHWKKIACRNKKSLIMKNSEIYQKWTRKNAWMSSWTPKRSTTQWSSSKTLVVQWLCLKSANYRYHLRINRPAKETLKSKVISIIQKKL